jgi:hypothetical protein
MSSLSGTIFVREFYCDSTWSGRRFVVPGTDGLTNQDPHGHHIAGGADRYCFTWPSIGLDVTFRQIAD